MLRDEAVPSKDSVIELYERHHQAYDRDRTGSTFFERGWVDRFLDLASPGGSILDLGCGVGEPIARHVVERGFEVVGVDGSPSMVERCRSRFPDSEWIWSDMRALDLGRRFDGIIAWDSFFHLTAADQRALIPRMASHAGAGAPLLFTSGPAAGEAIGTYQGERLYHASLDPLEYEQLLADNGFSVTAFVAEDPECGEHTVWLATHGPQLVKRGLLGPE